MDFLKILDGQLKHTMVTRIICRDVAALYKEKLKTFLKSYIDSELWFVCTKYIDNLSEDDAFKFYMYSKEGTDIRFGKIVNDALKMFTEDK